MAWAPKNRPNAVARGDTWSPTSSEDTSEASLSSLEALRGHVEAGEWREADEETRRLVIELAGEGAQRRGYVFFSEVQYIPAEELKAIDELWVEKSGGRFGYSVQRKIFREKAKSDFTNFFIKVGWMKKLESSEVEHYNYRAFPNEFVWEISDETPFGHLPLTNALRGTQLLAAIFSHPAFDQPTTVDLDQTSSQSSTTNTSTTPKSPFNTTCADVCT